MMPLAMETKLHEHKPHHPARKEHKAKMIHLFLCIMALMLIYPLVEDFGLGQQLLSLFLTLVLLTAIRVVSHTRIHIITGIALVIPAFLLEWTSYIFPNLPLEPTARAFMLLFHGFVSYRVLHFVFTARVISTDVLIAGVTGYLLTGITWSFFYLFIHYFDPGAIAVPNGNGDNGSIEFRWTDAIYFSFTTLTTLGYGDIQPISSQARAFTILESVTGVL